MAQGKFSITQEPQFDFRQTPMIPGTNVMQDSVMENFPIDPSKTGIEQLILNNIAQLSDANEGYINTSDVPQEQNLFQKGYDYLSGDRGGIARGILGLLTGGPIGALIGYNSPNIMSGVSDGISGLFKNFNDRRKGRLDVNADAGIMPTGIEIGAAQGSDAGFDNSDSGGYSGSANDGTSNAGYGNSDDGFI